MLSGKSIAPERNASSREFEPVRRETVGCVNIEEPHPVVHVNVSKIHVYQKAIGFIDCIIAFCSCVFVHVREQERDVRPVEMPTDGTRTRAVHASREVFVCFAACFCPLDRRTPNNNTSAVNEELELV